MVLSSCRQGKEEAAHAGGGNLFRAVVAGVLAWWPEEWQELALALDATTLIQTLDDVERE